MERRDQESIWSIWRGEIRIGNLVGQFLKSFYSSPTLLFKRKRKHIPNNIWVIVVISNSSLINKNDSIYHVKNHLIKAALVSQFNKDNSVSLCKENYWISFNNHFSKTSEILHTSLPCLVISLTSVLNQAKSLCKHQGPSPIPPPPPPPPLSSSSELLLAYENYTAGFL